MESARAIVAVVDVTIEQAKALQAAQARLSKKVASDAEAEATKEVKLMEDDTKVAVAKLLEALADMEKKRDRWLAIKPAKGL